MRIGKALAKGYLAADFREALQRYFRRTQPTAGSEAQPAEARAVGERGDQKSEVGDQKPESGDRGTEAGEVSEDNAAAAQIVRAWEPKSLAAPSAPIYEMTSRVFMQFEAVT